MRSLRMFCRENAGPLLLSAAAAPVFLGVFFLYGLDTGPFLYASLLYFMIFLAVWAVRFALYIRDAGRRSALLKALPELPDGTEGSGSAADADYARMLREMTGRIRELSDEAVREREEARDYYTMWVHQIKTPIAAMRMRLETEDVPCRAALEAELLRVEQYAEMALGYIRLESASSDLVFRMQPLDGIIRAAIRKFAPLFIARKLSVRYGGTELSALTDGKWLGFILEQLLSNAVKYTPSGTVAIDVSEDLDLTVSDTGIGIAPEDLPRIFEKGFTGHNGREENRSTGLGLYLCGLAAKKLGIAVRAQSEVGRGTRFTLSLAKEQVPPE